MRVLKVLWVFKGFEVLSVLRVMRVKCFERMRVFRFFLFYGYDRNFGFECTSIMIVFRRKFALTFGVVVHNYWGHN